MGDPQELHGIADDNFESFHPHSSPVIRLDSRRHLRRTTTRFRVPEIAVTNPIITESTKSSKSSRKISQTLESSLRSTKLNVFGAFNDITEKMRSSLHMAPQMRPIRSPLSFQVYLNHLDYSGRIINYKKYKQDVFSRGFDQKIRIDVWRTILNVFPYDSSIYVRDQFMADSSEDYYRLKMEWLLLVQSQKLPDKLKSTFNQIKGDVDRTDRNILFFAGAEGKARTVQLYEILCMYVYCHPSVAYRQGMADFAGLMLYVQNDEAKAYMCFCALMARLSKTFGDPSVILLQMDHLQQLLAYFDPTLEALINANKVELLFGPLYRWLMLEMKREFSFEDSLRILEVQWVMCRYKASRHGIKLSDSCFNRSNDRNPMNNVENWLMGQTQSASEDTRVVKSMSNSKSSTTMDTWLSVLSSDTQTISGKTLKDEDDESLTSSSQQVDKSSGGPTPGEILTSSNIESQNIVSSQKGSAALSRSCEVRSQHTITKNDRRGIRTFRTRCIPIIHDLGAGNPFLIFLCIGLLTEYRERLLKESRSGDVIGVFTAIYQSGTMKHNMESVLSRAYYFFKLYIHEVRKAHNNPSGLDDFV